MRKFIMLTACVGVLGLVMPDLAWGGLWSEIRTRNGTEEGQQYKQVGSGQYLECDDDNGDAGAKVVLYKQSGNTHMMYRCVIVPDLFDQDYWVNLDSEIKICSNHKCSGSSLVFPQNREWSVCAPAGRQIKLVGNSIITEGGTSEAYGCFFLTNGDPAQKTCEKAGNGAYWDNGQCRCRGVKSHWDTKAGQCKCDVETDIMKANGNCEPQQDITMTQTVINSGTNTATPGDITCPAGSDLYDRVKKSAECKIASAVFECTLTSVTTGKCLCGRCVTKARDDGDNNNNNNNNTPTCKQGRTTPNGVACCDLSSAEARYNKSTDQCVCTDTTKTFEIQNGKGVCIVKSVNIAEEACNNAAATGAFWDGKECKCRNPQHMFNGTICAERADITECKQVSGARWDDGRQLCVCNDPGLEIDWTKKQCVKSATMILAEAAEAERVARETSRSRIIAAGRVLDDISAQFKVSVWKNEDGGFNTARLASDSIAGVVLGTAGGLITSNVIKKNQIKGGFEDIKCTIGGQTVADWGDEFRVGIGLNGNY